MKLVRIANWDNYVAERKKTLTVRFIYELNHSSHSPHHNFIFLRYSFRFFLLLMPNKEKFDNSHITLMSFSNL
ncbi:CLUMA_CG007198, isoform A [Clunio marinus]|uniref:CLUMA_CG007198, isoform A n=1 Tax=Clunio marinus TaxID=568069 RepID=A0A1J1I079_9DIPT|nr:CLUMA_CG007198, isoform A [Clunio marinus]